MSDEVGCRIQRARREAGLNQAELANKIGAKNTTISNWELGVSRPDIDSLRALAKALRVDADYLLTGSDKEPAAESDGLGDIDRELISLLRQLTPEQERRAMDFVRGLLASR